MSHYPENSEYDYLCWVILCDRLDREFWEYDPLVTQHWQVYDSGDRAGYYQLWEQAKELRAAIVEESRHREDIVNWLHLDTELRQVGKTYPDVYELAGWEQCGDSKEF